MRLNLTLRIPEMIFRYNTEQSNLKDESLNTTQIRKTNLSFFKYTPFKGYLKHQMFCKYVSIEKLDYM